MKPKIDGTNINGQTPLHLACLASQEEIVEILLREGKADYDSRNIEGDCPAHLAVKVLHRICTSKSQKCTIGMTLSAPKTLWRIVLYNSFFFMKEECKGTMGQTAADKYKRQM